MILDDSNELDTMEMTEDEIHQRLAAYEDLRETVEWKDDPNYIPMESSDDEIDQSEAWEAILKAENENIAATREREQRELEFDINSEMRRLLGMDFSTGKLSDSESTPLKNPPSAPLVGNPVDVIRRRKLSQNTTASLPIVESDCDSSTDCSDADDDVLKQLARIHAQDDTVDDIIIDDSRLIFDPFQAADAKPAQDLKQSLHEKAAARRQRYAAEPSQKVVDQYLEKKNKKKSARLAAEEEKKKVESEARAARMELNKSRFQKACANNKARENKKVLDATAESDMKELSDRAKREARAKSRAPHPPST